MYNLPKEWLLLCGGLNMKLKKETQELAKILIKSLKKHGFVIQRYDAHSTESIYLKLDYGLAYTIRISGHEGKGHLKYTYNLIKNYQGRRFVKDGMIWRQYYSFSELNYLIDSILKNRTWVKRNYHPDYISAMEIAEIKNQGKPGFWSNAKLV